ncbi:hypothetical protein CVT24_007329 [Panaeolus cyanescens]|uniref:Uncharacterized protein n=1 Tax=Panaeolus cyanescens TaxID=181874 RepID=A0A409W5E8_9AGAR|nr:hypothetical protein CVT24_007329 [Panaeolus cyanescens]
MQPWILIGTVIASLVWSTRGIPVNMENTLQSINARGGANQQVVVATPSKVPDKADAHGYYSVTLDRSKLDFPPGVDPSKLDSENYVWKSKFSLAYPRIEIAEDDDRDDPCICFADSKHPTIFAHYDWSTIEKMAKEKPLALISVGHASPANTNINAQNHGNS